MSVPNRVRGARRPAASRGRTAAPTRRDSSPDRGVLPRLLCGAALVGASIGAAPPPAAAAPTGGAWTASGSIAFELRWFPQSPAFAGQLDTRQPSGLLEPELRWRSADRRHQVDLAGFGRWDGGDGERSHLDLREGSYRFVGDSFELLAGVSRVFWGVAESRHLIDAINQVDAVEDLDEEDRLGQPMVRLALDRDWGRLEVYSLIGFRERTFPGREGRLRPPLPVAERALYADDAGLDWALRWSRVAGDWDLAAHVFTGLGREPELVPAASGAAFTPAASGGALVPAAGGTALIPVYRAIDQAGVEVQYTVGAWLWKLEALARAGHGETFGAAVFGFERTFYQVGGSAADLGVLVEGLWDGRDAAAPPTIYDDDVFAGLRLALNDVQDTRLLAGAVIDRDDRSALVLVEAARRLGHRLTLELEARFFPGADPASDLAAFERDGFVVLRAAWHW
jgi:hypothetical protein